MSEAVTQAAERQSLRIDSFAAVSIVGPPAFDDTGGGGGEKAQLLLTKVSTASATAAKPVDETHHF